MPLLQSQGGTGISKQASAPGSPSAGDLWSDTDANILYRRNDANSAWLEVCTFGGGTTQTASTVPTVNAGATSITAVAPTTPRFLIGGWLSLQTNINTATYFPFWAIDQAAEANVDNAITFAFTVTRVRANVVTNSKNANWTIALRDDGASVGATTITSSTTGEYDSGAITTAIAAGSKINWLADTTGSASGNHQIEGCLAECSLP